MDDIIIISNDKVHISNGELSTNNNDTINLIDAIQSKFNIYLYSITSLFNKRLSCLCVYYLYCYRGWYGRTT